MKRLVILALAVSALAALVPTTTLAAGVKTGQYRCYVFFQPGVPTYTGRKVKIVSATKYAFFNTKTWRKGAYRASGSSLRFKTGPLKGKTGTYKVYGDGTPGISLQMTPGLAGAYSCSRG